MTPGSPSHICKGLLAWYGQRFRTKQKDPCATSVRHAACTVQGCGFVVKYQNTSNLEAHYTAAELDHEELADRLRQHQQLQNQTLLSVGADGSGGQTGKVVAPSFTKAKKARCDVKFVKWLVRKNSGTARPQRTLI